MVINSLPLYPWQAHTLTTIRDHWSGCIHTVKAPRQVGKSIMLEQLVVMAVSKGKGVLWLMSPSFKQSSKIFNEIRSMISSTPLFKKANESSMIIEFKNGSKLHFISGEQSIESLQGFTASGPSGLLIIDEASFISDEKISAVLPYCDVNQCPIIFTSTPQRRSGLFYKFYVQGFGDDIHVFSYDWCEYDLTRVRSEDKLDFYRRTLPAHRFKTYYLGEFLDATDTLFKGYDQVFGEPDDENRCYMGIDWSQLNGGDYTAVSIFNSKKQMVRIWYINEGDTTEIIGQIVKLIQQYRPIKVVAESNSMGKSNIDFLKNQLRMKHLTTQVVSFVTTNDSKRKIVDNLILAIQNNEVRLLQDGELIEEFDNYQVESTPGGKMTYNAAPGFHDDLIIATALALDGISKGVYVVGY